MYYIFTRVQEILLCNLYWFFFTFKLYACFRIVCWFQTFSQALTNKGYRGFESPFFLAGVVLFSFIFSWFTRATKHCQGLIGLPLVDYS